MQFYSGGTLFLDSLATDYIYLDGTSSSCIPTKKTANFIATDIPLAIVTTTTVAVSPPVIDLRTSLKSGGGTTTLTGLPPGTVISTTDNDTPSITSSSNLWTFNVPIAASSYVSTDPHTSEIDFSVGDSGYYGVTGGVLKEQGPSSIQTSGYNIQHTGLGTEPSAPSLEVLLAAVSHISTTDLLPLPATGTNGCSGASDTLTWNNVTPAFGCHQITGGGIPSLTVTGVGQVFAYFDGPPAGSATATSTQTGANDVRLYQWVMHESMTVGHIILEVQAARDSRN